MDTSRTAAQKVHRTYRLDEGLVLAIDAAAAEARVNQSELIAILLGAAIDDLRAGRIKLSVKPVRWTLTGVSRV